MGAVMLLLSVSIAFAQDVTISGTVKGAEDGMPIPGVSVVQKGTTNGTITDIDGNYSITAPTGSVIAFTFVGMKAQEVTVGAQTTVNISLESAAVDVDEVVVTALGISREKKSLGYAVTEVKNEEMTTVKDQNVLNALSGKVAGIQVNTSGAIGSSSHVVIRGSSSITGNNQPLYIIDGVPLDNTVTDQVSEGGTIWERRDFGSGASDINPDDIETLTVLKGPNAAALYGSRAANGAIIITTKSGKAGQGLGIDVSSTLTIDRVTDAYLPEFQNTYGSGIYENGVPTHDPEQTSSWGPKFDGQIRPTWIGNERAYSAQPDNVKDFFKTGVTSITNVSLSNGWENSSVRFSYTNMDVNGVMPGNKQKRNTFALRGLMELAPWLNLDSKLTYMKQEIEGSTWLGNSANNVTQGLFLMDRGAYTQDLENYKNEDGSMNQVNTGSTSNPYWAALHDMTDNKKDRLTGFAKLDVTFLPKLKGFVRVGTDLTHINVKEVVQKGHKQYGDGRLDDDNYFIQETNADMLLTFDHRTDNMSFVVNGGASTMYRYSTTKGVIGTGWKNDGIYNVNNLEEVTQNVDDLFKERVNSVYASASVGYKNFLFLDATARNDWSSTLPSDNRSYFYPSLSLSMLLSDAIDLSGTPISFFKLRGGWSKVGNDADPYQTKALVRNAVYKYNEVSLADVDNKPFLADLKPESTTNWEIGANLRLFNNRLYTDFTYYTSNSKDLIMTVDVSATTSYKQALLNAGEVENKGFELLVGGYPIKNKDFEWDVSFNISQNESKVIELADGREQHILANLSGVGGTTLMVATAGGGYGDIYGKRIRKDENGQYILNADGSYVTGEETVLGNVNPDFTGGLLNTFKYKNWTFRALVDMRIGGEVFSGTDAEMMNVGTSAKTLPNRESGFVMNGVTVDGDPVTNMTRTAQEYYEGLSQFAEPFVVDATNIRIKELALSYSVPLKNSVIKRASLGFVGRNLFFLYRHDDARNIDPNASFGAGNAQGVAYLGFPSTTSYGFNVNLSF